MKRSDSDISKRSFKQRITPDIRPYRTPRQRQRSRRQRMAAATLALTFLLGTGIPGTQARAEEITYTVKAGDSWWAIARAYGVNMYDLARWNNKSISDTIYVGNQLKVSAAVPAASTPGASSAPAASSDTAYAAAGDQVRLTTWGYKLRRSAEYSAGYYTIIPRSSTFTVQEQLTGGKHSAGTVWYKVSWNGSTGYVMADNSDQVIVRASTQTAPQQTETMYTTDALNLRSGPGTSFAIKLTIPNGSAVTVRAKRDNGWYDVTYNGVQGSVSSKWLSSSNGASLPEAGGAALTGDYVVSIDENTLALYLGVVGSEIGGNWDYDGTLMVAQTIVNRALRDSSSVYSVLTAPGQFTVVADGSWKNGKLNETQRQAAMDALRGKTILPLDSIYFCTDYAYQASSWFQSKTVTKIYQNVYFMAA